MSAVRSILCPVDLSASCGSALRQAVAIAALHGADVAAVAVRPCGEAAHPVEPAAGNRATHGGDAVWVFVHEMSGAAHVRVLPAAAADAPAIVRAASDVQADLIVMCAAHGGSGSDSMSPRLVPEQVIAAATCPVLSLPPVTDWIDAQASWRNILCGVEPTPSGRQALDTAVRLAEEWRSGLIVVHVLDDLSTPARRSRPAGPRAAELEMRAACEALVPAYVRTRCDVRILIGHGKPGEELLRLAEEWRVDLIVVGGRAPAGSVGQHVLRQAQRAVLCVPPPSA